MQITTYNSEKFDRKNRRYVIFGTIIAWVFILTIINKNLVGAILMFFLLWGYFYFSISNKQTITMSITKKWLIVATKTYQRSSLQWYVLEVDKKTKIIKNLVLVTAKWHSIHTLHDTKNNIKEFIVLLNDYIPILWDYEQSNIEKVIRLLQL